jgi:SAM-dependent methyltransferase
LFVKDGFPIARCTACRLVYVDAQIDQVELQSRYGADYYGGGVFHDYLGEREERIAAGRRYSETLARMQPSGRLLDVGCAAGFFLEAAASRWDVTGVELSPFAADYARREFGHRVLTGDIADVGLPDRSFEVVTLWNTIEHMADPRSAIGHVARVAAPDALVVLTTGDVGGPLARRTRQDWNLMTPPEHLSFFDPQTITCLLTGAGLEVRRIVHDGIVTTTGPLAAPIARTVASVAGLGNVMTVYARRCARPEPAHRAVSALRRRLRPLARV